MRVAASQLDGVFAAGADAGNVFEDVYGGGLGLGRRLRAPRGAGRRRAREDGEGPGSASRV